MTRIGRRGDLFLAIIPAPPGGDEPASNDAIRGSAGETGSHRATGPARSQTQAPSGESNGDEWMGVPSANTVVFLPDCENIEGPMAGGGSSARPAPPVGATPLVVPGAMDPASMVALAAFICWRRAGEDRGEADLELWCAGSDAPSGNKSRKTISQWCDLVETLLPERSRQLRAVAAFEESPAWETLLQAALMAIGQLEGEGEKSVTMEELCNSPSV